MENADSAQGAKSYIIESNGRKFSVPDADLTKMVYEAEGTYKNEDLTKALKVRDFSVCEVKGDASRRLEARDFFDKTHYGVIGFLAVNGNLTKYEQPVTTRR